MKSTKYSAIIITYSFDSEIPVILVKNEEEAFNYIQKHWNDERKLAIDNGFLSEEIDENTFCDKKEIHAKITFDNGDIMEWQLSNSVYQK